MRVFEQARRADGERPVDNLKQGEEVLDETFGKACGEKMPQNLVVGGVAERNWIQLVFGHEFIEDVGAQHDGARNRNCSALEVVADGVNLYNGVDERQAAAFAAQ